MMSFKYFISSATATMQQVFSGAKVHVCLSYVDAFHRRLNMVAADQNSVPVLISRVWMIIESDNLRQ